MAPKIGKVSDAEKKAGIFSTTLEMREVPYASSPRKVLKYGIMGYTKEVKEKVANGEEVPCVLAISGEKQQHVSRFFQSWKPEARGWVTVTPLRPNNGELFFANERSMQPVLEMVNHLKSFVNVEGGKVHVVGTSNGGTSALYFAAHHPELVKSVHVVTGSLTQYVVANVDRILGIPIHIIAGDADELGFHRAALEANGFLTSKEHPRTKLTILPGAGHFTVGQFIDAAAFWAEMEALRAET
eukprot:TRINITY_DN14095_c0_g1_i2.p2 TRINITY_DN14095_c0_g1~~TRINITY_DN14095_c0_g1_i2.p2  ORF type:complete len:242 (+),score=93.87 TRINITY_DN14095_c0_g1_i2:105-830(+)